MTSMIPESIIQKIMLFSSHPVADILKASFKFKLQRGYIDGVNNCNIFLVCFECGENTDWIDKDTHCYKCRIDECIYCGSDLTDPDYDPDFRCIHCS